MFPIYVVKRPGVKEFLEHMKGLYEVIIFTASLSLYADPLLDLIDTSGCISYRLFRDHCTLYNNTFVKDLSVLGRDLKNVIIVDNSPTAYMFQPENAIPILTWFDDMKDTKLFELAVVLELMASVKDVRDVVRATVKDNSVDYVKLARYLQSEVGAGETSKPTTSASVSAQVRTKSSNAEAPANDIVKHGFNESKKKKVMSKKDALLRKAMQKSTPDNKEDPLREHSRRRKKCGTPTPQPGLGVAKNSVAENHELKSSGHRKQ